LQPSDYVKVLKKARSFSGILFFFGNAWGEAVYVIFYTELAAIYINISRTDRPPVLKTILSALPKAVYGTLVQYVRSRKKGRFFRLEWEPENTPRELNRRTAPATYQLRQGVAHALNDWNL
jgi:hypothetical protein